MTARERAVLMEMATLIAAHISARKSRMPSEEIHRQAIAQDAVSIALEIWNDERLKQTEGF